MRVELRTMTRVGRFRHVHVKDDGNKRLRVLLSGRRLLKRKLVDLENELRGSSKASGIRIGAVSRSKLEAHTLELVEAFEPLIRDFIAGLLAVRRAVWSDYKRLHNALVGPRGPWRRVLSAIDDHPRRWSCDSPGVQDSDRRPTSVQSIPNRRRPLWTDAETASIRHGRLRGSYHKARRCRGADDPP